MIQVKFGTSYKIQLTKYLATGWKVYFRGCDGLIVGAVMVLLQKHLWVYCRGGDAAISETVMNLLYRQ